MFRLGATPSGAQGFLLALSTGHSWLGSGDHVWDWRSNPARSPQGLPCPDPRVRVPCSICSIDVTVYSSHLIGYEKIAFSQVKGHGGSRHELAAESAGARGSTEAVAAGGQQCKIIFLTVSFESLHFLCFVLVCTFVLLVASFCLNLLEYCLNVLIL